MATVTLPPEMTSIRVKTSMPSLTAVRIVADYPVAIYGINGAVVHLQMEPLNGQYKNGSLTWYESNNYKVAWSLDTGLGTFSGNLNQFAYEARLSEIIKV